MVPRMPRLTGNNEQLYGGWIREVDRIAEQYDTEPLSKIEVYTAIWAACLVMQYDLTPENVIGWIIGVIDEYERAFAVDAVMERKRQAAEARDQRKLAEAAQRRRRAELRRKAAR